MDKLFDGEALAEGKTKIIGQIRGNPDQVLIQSKDDITAGDGAKHDILPGKAGYSTRTTCHVFGLLKGCGLPVAFDRPRSETSFLAPRCHMLPYEVVTRREAHGSFLKRHPGLNKGQLFPRLVLEFYLKTKGRRWKDQALACDDPYLQIKEGRIALFEPSKPIHGQKPFLTLAESQVFAHSNERALLEQMDTVARRAFLVLEKAWQLEGRTLADCKVEFGLTARGELLLADVIDNDSWRVLEQGAYIDKQVYREGGALEAVAENYRRVAELTARFRLPNQRVAIWTGSEKDDPAPLEQTLAKLSGGTAKWIRIACSVHKEPLRAMGELNRLIQEVPDTVLIAYVGRSNGAGPTLSACAMVPVIALPAGYEEFPEDVWSSLRAPSNVPVMTVLEPANAALAALEILALHNPQLYMLLREPLERRLINQVTI